MAGGSGGSGRVVRLAGVLFAALALAACQRDEPTAGGEPLRHWAHEARQYSLMPWWNSRGDERRHEAFRRLSEIGEPAVPTLLQLLREGIPMSGDALNALCQLGPRASSGVPALIRMLGATDVNLRVDAVTILGHIGPAAEPAVPALAAALHDPNRGLRLMAGEALGRIGGAAREALERAARDGDAGVREAAVAGLSIGGRDTGTRRDVLASALDDADPAVRAQALGRLHAARREEAEAMADLLVRGLNDASPEVREVARRQFIGLYQHQLVTPRLLVKVLASADPESRADAAWQLGNGFAAPIPAMRDTATPETAEALRTAVRDPEPKVRIYAARALLGADPAARDTAAATLRDAMRVVDVELQVRAARVLWQATHAPPEVLDAYERGLTAGGKYVRFEAMDGIREMGPAAEPLRPALERLDEDADREVRHRAEVTLAALRPRQ